MRAALAPSLAQLRTEIDKRWPHRDRSSDGWIGDTAHSARVSDHNPDDSGMVHALDVDVDGINVKALLREVIGDPRVWYVIHALNGVPTIWSRTHGWAPRRYLGANPHTKHVHVSILYSAAAEQSRTAWFPPPVLARPKPPARVVDLSQAVAAFKADPGRRQGGTTAGSVDDIRLIEAALADLGYLPRKYATDGSAGSLSVRGYAAYQRAWLKRHGRRITAAAANGIPGIESATDLGRDKRVRQPFTVKA